MIIKCKNCDMPFEKTGKRLFCCDDCTTAFHNNYETQQTRGARVKMKEAHEKIKRMLYYIGEQQRRGLLEIHPLKKQGE